MFYPSQGLHQDIKFYMLCRMSTTLPLDDDYAILLKHLCDERQISLKTQVEKWLAAPAVYSALTSG